jgi:hypothetical protein
VLAKEAPRIVAMTAMARVARAFAWALARSSRFDRAFSVAAEAIFG